MKTTPWFPVGTKPKRVGVYEVAIAYRLFRYFDGQCWFIGGQTPKDAMRVYRHNPFPFSPTNLPCWRGLKERP